MAITYQNNANGSSSGSTITTGAFSGAVNAGDLLVIFIYPYGSNSSVTLTVTDNLNSGNYVNAVNSYYSAGELQFAAYYMVCNASGSAGTTTIMATYTGGSGPFTRAYAVHYNGFVNTATLVSADTTAVNSGDSTNPTTTSFNNSYANEVSLLGCGCSTTVISASPSGWTNRIVGNQVAIWDQYNSTSGNSVSASITLTGTAYWQTAVASFYDAPAGAAIAWIT